ncbi:MAG: co-chaperone GroES [Planctomycetes bacterium]|nr:co-chaperone GroES [Planctomycetota bacterium]MCO5167432.1 co-chaperone GroES [Planctomycetota bacterium]MCW8139538.1 co-chaperone GroES [Planctomycetota bacterium]
MRIRPLDDRVLIKPIEAEDKTAGGIVLPDTAKEKSQRGEVVEVGAGKLLETGDRAALSVKKGDRVVFGKYAGTEIKIEGTQHQIMREHEILAVLEEA